jgi:hypothetical protein
MQSKYLALLFSVVAVISVLYTQYNTEREITTFANWMNQYNVNYDSIF